MKPNPGYCPAEAAGRRVDVLLVNGMLRQGWAADGRTGCRWSRTDSPFDIAEYEVVG